MSAKHSWAILICLASPLNSSFAEDKLPILRDRIDQLIGLSAESPMVSDAQFGRRVYLDLTGRIPAVDKVNELLEGEVDREALVDGLLDTPEHARHMQYVFDVILMERQYYKNIPTAQWQDYLQDSFRTNKPWDQMAREILSADGTQERVRPAAMFLLGRELKPDVVTRDLGRMFLGRDLQCAQCHDHPNVGDYMQQHYYGLTAFLSRSYLFKDPKTKETLIGEKAEGAVEFTSVFTEESGKTPPRILDFPAIEDPPAEKEPYKVKPTKKTRAIPVYSRRDQLADAMTSPQNEAFRLNIANRIWAMLMGRGLVEPVDMMHSENPPVHPELLQLLANALMESGFDLRFLLKEIILSRAYQAELPAENDNNPITFQMKPLSAEQLAWSMMQATGIVDQTRKSVIQKQQVQDKKKKTELHLDPDWREQAITKALANNVTAFAKVFGVTGVQSNTFESSADQALFLKNGGLVYSWIQPSGDRLTARLKGLPDDEVANAFTRALFTRDATKDEQQQVVAALKNTDARVTILRELVWAGLTSAEFRFNH